MQDATAAIAADSTTPPGRTGDTTGSSEGNEGSGTGDELLRRASSWLPFLRGQAADATTLAHRVIPADGLPAIGFSSQSGAYVVASHSAITLAPILSASPPRLWRGWRWRSSTRRGGSIGFLLMKQLDAVELLTGEACKFSANFDR